MCKGTVCWGGAGVLDPRCGLSFLKGCALLDELQGYGHCADGADVINEELVEHKLGHHALGHQHGVKGLASLLEQSRVYHQEALSALITSLFDELPWRNRIPALFYDALM